MSLVYNTNISKTEYLVDLENNGKAKQTALLSMSSTAPSGTFQKGSQYFNSTDKKIYTAVEDNVWGTTGKDPNFGIIYQCNNEYYVWDGDNLITTDLEGYEKLVNKATNFNTVNNTKYPTTKAVADYVVKESIVRNFTDAGITKTTSSDVFSDRTNNTGLAEEILAKQFPTGTTLYGEVRNQGMPTGIGNAEIRVEILETKSNGAQVIEFTLFSVDIEPKEWSHIYFSSRTEQQNPWIWVPKAVPTDDYTSNATTTVPTSKALSDGLALKQDISNISQDYTENSKSKYPSSFALTKGLNTVKPSKVTNSGASLPAVTGYQLGDTFLNTSNKKIYTTKNAGNWKLNTSVTNTATIDFETGIASGFYFYQGSIKYITRNSNPCKWVGDTTLKVHFKFESSSDSNRVIISSFTGNSNNYRSQYASIFLDNNKLYFVLSWSQMSSPNIISKIQILDTILSNNTEYYLQINKTGETATAILSTNNYSDNSSATILETNTFETQDYIVSNYNSSSISYGNAYVGGNGFDNGYVYLVDSSGEFLVPDDPTALEWNSGESLIDLSQYADITNGIMYFYCDNILFSNAPTFARLIGQPEDNTNLANALGNKQDKNLLFTSKSANTWIADNTYPDYAYKCVISCTGVTANTYAIVNFAQTEADSGNYATICETGNGTVTIYSKVNDSITIPSIIVMGV